MGYEAKKTEHSGPKKGSGAYWGRKADAKKQSNRERRKQDKLLTNHFVSYARKHPNPS